MIALTGQSINYMYSSTSHTSMHFVSHNSIKQIKHIRNDDDSVSSDDNSPIFYAGDAPA